MIARQDISLAGSFTKVHGIKGELTALLRIPATLLEQHPMFICEADGILVPFFIEGIRPRSAQSALIKPEGIDNEAQAKAFVDKDFYVPKHLLAPHRGQEDPAAGAYADDLAGYSVVDRQAGHLGVVTGIEDSTANALFILRTPEDKTLYIPIAEPFITALDHDTRTLHTDLPEGLADLRQ